MLDLPACLNAPMRITTGVAESFLSWSLIQSERKEPVQCDYSFDKNGVMLVRFAPLSLATLLDNGALTARSITLDQLGSSSSGLQNREALYGVPSLKLAPRYVL